MKHETKFSKDATANKLNISREFDASVDKVWKAWTVKDILDQWWAPRPWRAETKSLDFRSGGTWLYSMVGPNGDRHRCRVDFTAIETQSSFKADSSFCDENDNPNPGMPVMHWHTRFSSTATGSRIDVTISFDKEADLNTIVTMGFEQGFKMGLGNLEELLSTDVKH
jgi:uncharacterized protein YndB with AHSA1/START domain